MKLSLVTTALNEDPEIVAATLHGAIATTQGYEREIILVDDGSDTPLAFEHPIVRIVRNEHPTGVAGARRLGTSLARGELLVILDAHMSFAPGWVEAFLAHAETRALMCSPWWSYRHSEVWCWGADFRWHSVPSREGFVGLGIAGRARRGSAGEAEEVPVVIGACYAMLREEFERLGGYTPIFSRYSCDEQELSARAWLMGHGVRLVAGARVGHLNRDEDTNNGRLGVVPYEMSATHFMHNQYVMMKTLFEERTVQLLSPYYEPLQDETARSVASVDIEDWRRRIQPQRRMSDKEFFQRFVPKAPLRFNGGTTRLRRGERPNGTIVAAVAAEEAALWRRVTGRKAGPESVRHAAVQLGTGSNGANISFSCLGSNVRIRLHDRRWLDDVLRTIPGSCSPCAGEDYALDYEVLGRTPRIEIDGTTLELEPTVSNPFQALERDLTARVWRQAKDFVFLDAAVVAHRGRATLLLGDRRSGRFALLAALLRRGASYYSDVYAILHRDGRVHPWARTPQTTAEPGLEARNWPRHVLAPEIGREPVPVGQIVLCRMAPGARWRPRSLSAGCGLSALVGATIRRDPSDAERSFLAAHAACEQVRVWVGERSGTLAPARFLLSSDAVTG